MRTYTALDKQVITAIVKTHLESKTNCLSNVLYDIEPNQNFLLEHTNGKVSIFINKKYIEKISENDASAQGKYIKSIISKLWSVVNILDYLSQNGLLSLSDEYGDFSSSYDNTDYIECNYKDEETKRKLLSYITKKLIPSQELIDLNKNNYKDKEAIKEEKNNHRNTILTVISIIIALGSLVTSLVLGYLELKRNNGVYIENKPLEVIIEKETWRCPCSPAGILHE